MIDYYFYGRYEKLSCFTAFFQLLKEAHPHGRLLIAILIKIGDFDTASDMRISPRIIYQHEFGKLGV